MRLNSMRRSHHLLLLGALAAVLAGCGGAVGGGVAKGNAVHGKELYTQCQACHKLTENYVGPMHCGLIGRPAGSASGYDYSEAMKASGIVWDPQKLNEFLTSPIAYVSGTKMGFAGFESATDRADVIAYLVQANADPAVCPKK
jgi:cytochrome c